jgi:hypothetical protein
MNEGSVHGQSGSERVYVVHRCPECFEQITESEYDPEKGRIWGHYHDPPDGWEGPEDPWFDAERIEVRL